MIFTIHRKPPRVKSDILAKQRQKGGSFQNEISSTSVPLLPPSDAPPPSLSFFQQTINDDRSDPFKVGQV